MNKQHLSQAWCRSSRRDPGISWRALAGVFRPGSDARAYSPAEDCSRMTWLNPASGGLKSKFADAELGFHHFVIKLSYFPAPRHPVIASHCVGIDEEKHG